MLSLYLIIYLLLIHEYIHVNKIRRCLFKNSNIKFLRFPKTKFLSKYIEKIKYIHKTGRTFRFKI